MGIDVYENEKGVFFYDCTDKPQTDGVLQQLLLKPNVIITPHQAFATKEALTNLAQTTFHTLYHWSRNETSPLELLPGEVITYDEDVAI